MDKIHCSLENTVAVWADAPLACEIISLLNSRPWKVRLCENAVDIIAAPHFILVADGAKIFRNDPHIDELERYWGESAEYARQYRAHMTEAIGNHKTRWEERFDIGPSYKPPVVLFSAEKSERRVNGLCAIAPPGPETVPFSDGLSQWLIRLISAFHDEALMWRQEMTAWNESPIVNMTSKLK